MNKFVQFYSTTIGKKFVVAISGVAMIGFLIMHMIGNFKAFSGENKLDSYASFLREFGQELFGYGTLLWIARIILLLCVLAHIVTIILLTKQNRAARPIQYQNKKTRATSISSKMMVVSGFLLLVFIIVHLAQFTLGWFRPTPFEYGKVYSNISQAFAVSWITLFYVFMMFVVCMHLYHGIWSFFQTMGLDNPDRNKHLRTIAVVTSIGLFIGFSIVPIAFLFRLLS